MQIFWRTYLTRSSGVRTSPTVFRGFSTSNPMTALRFTNRVSEDNCVLLCPHGRPVRWRSFSARRVLARMGIRGNRSHHRVLCITGIATRTNCFTHPKCESTPPSSESITLVPSVQGRVYRDVRSRLGPAKLQPPASSL